MSKKYNWRETEEAKQFYADAVSRGIRQAPKDQANEEATKGCLKFLLWNLGPAWLAAVMWYNLWDSGFAWGRLFGALGLTLVALFWLAVTLGGKRS